MNTLEIKGKISELIRQDNYIDAFDQCLKVFEISPNDEDNLKTALFLFERIQAGNKDFQPRSAKEYALRANAFQYYGEIEKCFDDINSALTIDPNYDYALQCRSFLFREKGEYTKAINDIMKAITLAPNKGEYYGNAAVLHMEIGEIPMCMGLYEIAVNKDPENAGLWFNFGVDLAETGYLELALEKFNKAIEIWPQFEDAIVNRNHVIKFLERNKK